MTNTRYRHAIVIGGSIAGLLTARVLSEQFAQITIVERDMLPDGYAHRKGTPQAHHAHALLARGAEIMEQLFPGIAADWAAAGARTWDVGEGLELVVATGRAPRMTTGIPYHSLSRVLVEGSLRQRVQRIPNVTLRQGVEVRGLHTDASRRVVDGVWLRTAGSNEEPQWLAADLVVDASGRDSKLPTWLERLGNDKPSKTVVKAQGGYASRWYKLPAAHTGGSAISWVLLQPPHTPRAGVILPTEDDTAVLTLLGTNGTYPPADEAEFAAYAAALPDPLLAEIIRGATPISDIFVYRRIESQMWHYHQMRTFPERLLVLGDASVSLNPLYGQGMTVAAMSAAALQATLQQSPSLDGLGRAFQNQLASVVAPFWQIATSEDMRWPTVEGARPTVAIRFLHWYMDGVMALIPTHPRVCLQFLQVQHALTTPTALFKPRVLLPVLGYALRSQGKRFPRPGKNHHLKGQGG
jgi:2-polyprenyl-6-methoxyphenol hydroxylase-like FAD-dependent oxidoreductase